MPKPLLSVGELIDQSWDVFRSRMSELLSISGWLLVTAILFAIALAFLVSIFKEVPIPHNMPKWTNLRMEVGPAMPA